MKKGIFFAILVLIAAVATFAGAGAYYFGSLQRGNGFLDGTVVNGQDVSGQTPAQVTAGYASEVGSGEVVLMEGGNEVFRATLADLGYALDEKAFEESLTKFMESEKSDTKSIFNGLVNGNSFSLAVPYTFDEDTFNKAVKKEALTAERVENTNAKIVYSEEDEECRIQPEVQGTQLHVKDLREWLKGEIPVVFTEDSVNGGQPADSGDDAQAKSTEATETAAADAGGASAEEGGAEGKAAAAAAASETEKTAVEDAAEEKTTAADADSAGAGKSDSKDAETKDGDAGKSDEKNAETKDGDAGKSDEKDAETKDGDAGKSGKKDADAENADAEQPDEENSTDSTEGFSIVRTIPSSLYIKPEVTSSNKTLVKKCGILNSFAKESITYVFGGERETLEFKTFMNWIKIRGDEVTVRPEKVTEYVTGLAQKYNTRYRDRVFNTTWGGEVTFPAGLNEYGYTILEEQEAAQLTQDILSGQSVEREPIYFSYNDWGDPCYLGRNGQDDLNGTYVEVSIGAQHMWYYLNGQLFLESDVVTGDVTLDQGTASGVFPLAFKESPATLKGGEGKKKYTTKVQYWMPFYEGQGLHDAWWKTVFGGEEYKGNGSHGCVNLPSAVAETLYNNIVPGTAIVIYN